MKTKRFLAFILALSCLTALALPLTSCSEQDDGKYTVGICQLAQHPALDAATQGFRDAITDALGAENVTFLEQNAQGDSTTCTTIVNDFVTKKVDLIMANATAALQAAANATLTIPVLGTSITEYSVALGLENFNGTVGGNVSGTSDLAPLDQQAAMITEWFPNAQKVGFLFCSGEPNSRYQVDQIKAELAKSQIETKEFSFADSNEVASVAAACAAYADVIYIPTDNMAASCAETINGAIGNKPVIAGEEGVCKPCGVATLSISYYDLGRKTGEMAVSILRDKADISKMAIAYAPATKKYNAAKCTELALTPPAGYNPIGA